MQNSCSTKYENHSVNTDTRLRKKNTVIPCFLNPSPLSEEFPC